MHGAGHDRAMVASVALNRVKPKSRQEVDADTLVAPACEGNELVEALGLEAGMQSASELYLILPSRAIRGACAR